MKHALRLLTGSLLTLVVSSCCVLRCTAKPPTPIIGGPDSGWVRAPVKFSARSPDGGPAGNNPSFSWGDGRSSFGNIHTYAEPGAYSVTVRVFEWPEFGPGRSSDPSEPHRIRILDDALTHPDSVVATVAAGSRSSDWACVLPDGRRLYVTNAAADSLLVVDADADTVLGSIAVPDSPTCCVASSSGQFVYVSCATAQVVAVVRTQDNAIVDTIGIAGSPGRMAILPNDSLLYVAHTGDDEVSVFRVSDGSCISNVAVDGVPSGLAARPAGDFVFVACEARGTVSAIRTADNAVAFVSVMGCGPTDVAFSPTGDTAYVCCPSTRSIALLRAADLTLLESVSHDSFGFASPTYASLLPGVQCLYVTSSQSGAGPAILRRSDNYLLRLTGVGKSRVAVPSPDGSRVYVPAAAGVVVLGLRQSR